MVVAAGTDPCRLCRAFDHGPVDPFGTSVNHSALAVGHPAHHHAPAHGNGRTYSPDGSAQIAA